MKPGQTLYPMEGVEIRLNPKNGFLVFQCHYKADPMKRDPKYIQEIKESMPIRRFKQEYELQWDSFEGLSVFADWDINVHGVKTDIKPQIGLPLLLGFDFGLTPAVIVCQMQEDTFCVLREYTALNMGAERFLQWLTPQLKIQYHLWQSFSRDYLVFIDPSGEFRKDTDEGTCAKVIDDFGFKNIIPGPVAWEERKKSVEHFLTRRTMKGPSFQVCLQNCPILVRGFQGGYRYDDKVLELEPNKLRPKKDIHSHIQDALQMVTSRILNTRPSAIIDVPVLSYKFTKDYDQRDARFEQ
jgi:hypothetical protein